MREWIFVFIGSDHIILSSISPKGGFMFLRTRYLGLILAVVIPATPLTAFSQPVRIKVAQAHAPDATFSARPANGNQFHTLADNADLFSGDLIVSLPGGVVASKNNTVHLKALSDFDGRSPLPILETAFSLNDPQDVDFDFVLDRGRVDLTNAKKDGPAVIRLKFWDQTWKIILDEPDARVAVELCARWPSGTRFKLAERGSDPSKSPAPVATLVLLVLKGSATVNLAGTTLAMKSPPAGTV
jgi:hypothetical protein